MTVWLHEFSKATCITSAVRCSSHVNNELRLECAMRHEAGHCAVLQVPDQGTNTQRTNGTTALGMWCRICTHGH